MSRRVVLRVLLVGGGLAVLAGVVARTRSALNSPPTAEHEPVINIAYPYTATVERERLIRTEFPRIRPGASATEVRDTLGSPDEVRPLYEPLISNGRRIGTTYWYFLEKKSADRNDDTKAVRLSFDSDERVTQVESWGL